MLLKEMYHAAKAVRAARKLGVTGKLALVEEAELEDTRAWLARNNVERKLLQECIEGLSKRQSPCLYCQEYAEKSCDKINGPELPYRGCENWWLRFLTPEEEETIKKELGINDQSQNSDD